MAIILSERRCANGILTLEYRETADGTEKDISKNALCSFLDIPRANFNRYCRDEFQRIDANLICKLCAFFGCTAGDLIEFVEEESDKALYYKNLKKFKT